MNERAYRFVKINIIVESIAICNLIVGMVAQVSAKKTSGLTFYLIALCIDLLITFVLKGEKLHNLTIALRYMVILLLSFHLVFFYDRNLLAISGLVMLTQIFDLVFRIDFTDLYSRLIVLSVTAFPVALFTIIEQLFFATPGSSYTIDIISVIATLIVMIVSLSKIFIDWFSEYDKRLLEQRRQNDDAAENNQKLILSQEKLKKVNEEIGIEKFRVDAANRLVSKTNLEMRVQNEILKKVSSSINQEEIMIKAAEALCEGMQLKFCVVSMHNVDDATKMIYHEKHTSISEKFMKHMRYCVLERDLQELEELKEIRIDKALNHLYNNALTLEDELSAIVVVPILNDMQAEGVIICGHERQDFFDDSKTVLNNIATQILMAWKNAKLYSTMQQMAIRDSLTKLYNRRQLNLLVEEYNKAAIEEKTPLSVAMIDIDNFKKFNDTYGHAFGDIVLCELARLINECGEKNEGIASRYGGEEFVLVFPGKDMQKTYTIIKEFQDTINSTKLDYKDSSVLVHASMGISSYPQVASNPESLINRADSAMYYGKQHGKNQIVLDSDEVLEFFNNRAKDALE